MWLAELWGWAKPQTYTNIFWTSFYSILYQLIFVNYVYFIKCLTIHSSYSPFTCLENEADKIKFKNARNVYHIQKLFYEFTKVVLVVTWNIYSPFLLLLSWHLFSLSLDSVDGAVGILVHIWLFPVIVLISILSPRRWPYPGRGYKRNTRHWHEESL